MSSSFRTNSTSRIVSCISLVLLHVTHATTTISPTTTSFATSLRTRANPSNRRSLSASPSGPIASSLTSHSSDTTSGNYSSGNSSSRNSSSEWGPYGQYLIKYGSEMGWGYGIWLEILNDALLRAIKNPSKDHFFACSFEYTTIKHKYIVGAIVN
jgi:hypothetical protein